jgi:hypothetical protein
MKTLTKLILKSAITGGTFIGLGLLSAPAQAINITYTFDSSFSGQSSVNQTVSGVTGTFSNINGLNGVFQSNFDGIYLNSALGAGNSFHFSFDKDKEVTLLSYSVTNSSLISSGETATFRLFNSRGPDSTGNNLASVGSFGLSNPFTMGFGVSSALTATLSLFSDTAQLQSITVDATPTPVPLETDALSVVGSTILFGFGVWSKRKSAKPIQK